MLVDLNEIGMVDCEIHALDKRLTIQLNVPSEYRIVFETQRDALSQAIRKIGYGVEHLSVSDWIHTRTLLDVFPHLQALQTGIDAYA